jgi:beta-N-acetylhexosaminidase
VDLLLVAYDGQQFYRIMRCALKAQASGRLDGQSLAASDGRLTALTAAGVGLASAPGD